jgi:hypothetical protein
MNAFWASENFDAFMVIRSLQPREPGAENSNNKRSGFAVSDHWLAENPFRFSDRAQNVIK